MRHYGTTCLRFSILGPLTVFSGDRVVPVGGARQRTILAMLLLNADQVVPTDTLVEAVWQDQPPVTARTQVAICIASLRKAFKAEGYAGDVIMTHHPGYRLFSEGHQLDLLQFEGLVSRAEEAAAQGQPGDASRHYEEALRLWRGPLLPGLSGQIIQRAVGQLEETLMTATEEAALLQLTLGKFQQALIRLATLVREHPLRERARHSLMLVQYRLGRRAEALETFRQGRRISIDELGIEPGADLQRLHDAILRDDRSLADYARLATGRGTALRPPSHLPPNMPNFVGRLEQIAFLDKLAAGRSHGQPPGIGLITGAAGVGKTGLAVHWAHRVAAAFPDGRLYVNLGGYDGTEPPVTPGQVLDRFLRAFDIANEQIPSNMDERIALYRSLVADRRVLVVLDNARSFAQVAPLLPTSGLSCAIVTSREPMVELTSRHNPALVALPPLTSQEATGLLAELLPGRVPLERHDDVERLTELCSGLPLALREAAAHLALNPHWSLAHLLRRLSDEQRCLNELSQVRNSIAASYRRLSPNAAFMYRRLARLDVPDFTHTAGAALLGCEVLLAERLVEELTDARLLEVSSIDGPGQFRYRLPHLFRMFAIERLAQEEEASKEGGPPADSPQGARRDDPPDGRYARRRHRMSKT